jgi:superfamily II DNA/RNA helicase
MPYNRNSSQPPRGRGGNRSARFGGDSARSRSFGDGGQRRPSRFGGSRRPSGNFAPSFGGRSNRTGRSMGGSYIDPAKLVYRASVVEEVEEYVPTHSFADFVIPDGLKDNIAAKGYTVPSPIQDAAIPHGLMGKDIVGIAETGTGKTAAFLIPLISKTVGDRKAQTLIVVPTRELAIQIEDEFRGFTKGAGMHSVVLVGGAPIGPQLRALRHFNNFIIGTPGRIKDMLERRALDLSNVTSLVLDEADRMLDMGFIHDIRYLVSLIPKERQTMFFSATMTREIESLIHAFLTSPVKVSVKKRETSKNVDQDIIRVRPGENKFDILTDLLRKPGFDKVLVFGRTKHGVEKLSATLQREGIRAESIHGNKNHNQRIKALNLFKESHAQVLVATDVAARGLDIKGVSHVINFDMPGTYEDYVHRIGRTGRAGAKGFAITFVE